MKKILPLMLLVVNLSVGQTTEKVPSTLQNVIVTLNQISGNANPDRIVKVSTGNDSIPEYSIIVNRRGYFEQTFATALSPATKISVWTVDETGKKSYVLPFTSEAPEEILNKVRLNSITLPHNSINPEVNETQPASTTYRYNARILNTNFTIPIVRFNLTKSDDTKDKQGDVLLFNSIGAGVGVSWGQFEKTTDANGETINSEFTNSFGIHLGVLFSAGSNETENKNVFAPSISISILDFQIGYGHELGTLASNQKKGFLTVAYAIPISKLLKGKYYIFRASKGYNSKNPLPIPVEETASEEIISKGKDGAGSLKKSSKSDWKVIRSFVQ